MNQHAMRQRWCGENQPHQIYVQPANSTEARMTAMMRAKVPNCDPSFMPTEDTLHRSHTVIISHYREAFNPSCRNRVVCVSVSVSVCAATSAMAFAFEGPIRVASACVFHTWDASDWYLYIAVFITSTCGNHIHCTYI